MLAEKDAMATVAVKDLKAARKFYVGTLGLVPVGPEDAEVAVLRSGTSSIVVYQSEFAGTNKATSITWGVGEELERIVERLKQAGVAFEHYELPGADRKGDIHIFGGFQAAWFKDPEGNILHINNG
jgi:catechol 2,3-dioxygenase-like lactoylglutathione lyase family enzyme